MQLALEQSARRPAPAAADRMPYVERRYTSQDGLSLYYRDYGDPASERTTVLCLPGMTRNSKDFDPLARRLCGERRVICPDYRGRGRSDYDPDWRHYRPETDIGDIRHLLAAAGAERVIVVGTSMGGLLAAGMAVYMPTQIAGAVVNDVGPRFGDDGLDNIIHYLTDTKPHDDWDDACNSMLKAFPNLPVYTDGDLELITRATFREGPDGRIHPDWDAALVRPLLEGHHKTYDFMPLFRALGRLPGVALRGELSDVLSAATFEEMADILPRFRTLTLPGVGHAPSLGEAEVLDAIDDLLRSH